MQTLIGDDIMAAFMNKSASSNFVMNLWIARFWPFAVVYLMSIAFSGALAQNFSGLQGSQLIVEQDLSPAGALRGMQDEALRIKLEESGMKEGQLVSVQVKDDYENRLIVEVGHQGFEAEAYIYAEVLNQYKKRLRQISPSLTTLLISSNTAELSFDLNEREQREGVLESAFLRIVIVYPFSKKLPLKQILSEIVESRVTIFADAIDAMGLSTIYRLPKKWKSRFAKDKPTNITISLTPIGRANSIPASSWLRYNFPSVPEKEFGAESKGPSNRPISLWERLHADVDFQSQEEISAISMVIYPDKNRESGVYYYLPLSYHLQWDENEGPHLKMSYESLTENQSEGGEVMIAASLTPSILKTDIEAMRSLLVAFMAQKGQLSPVLQPMPLHEAPQVALALGTLYKVPTEKISVVAGSTIFEPIEVTWVSDSKTKDDIEVHLVENLGIRGSAQLIPRADSLSVLELPIRITLADPRTFGRLDLNPRNWRTTPWRNMTSYPLKLLRMHRLVLKPVGNELIPTIYSWSLDDIEIPTNAEVTFISNQIPMWIDRPEFTKRLWLEYKVLRCRECDQKVFGDINSATTQSGSVPVFFESIDILQQFGARFLEVKVRSIQADPRRQYTVVLPATKILQDGKSFIAGRLFVPDGRPPEFDYHLRIITANRTYNAYRWLSSNDLNVYINQSILEQAFDDLPDSN